MELTFRLDDEDYRDFVRHARASVDGYGRIRSRLSAVAWVFWILAALAVISTYEFLAANRTASLGYWYAAVLFIIGWVATWYWYLRRYSDLQTKYFNSPDGHFKQEQRLSVTESGVLVEQAGSSQKFEWTAIKSLQQSDRLFFLHIDTAHALCVPKKVFSSTEEANRFADIVKGNVVASGKQPVSGP